MTDEGRLASGDIVRFLQELAASNRESTEATRELRASVDALRSEIAHTYVRQDVWLEARKSDAEAGLVLQQQVQSLISWRDWALKIIVGAVILALLGLVLVSNGGATP